MALGIATFGLVAIFGLLPTGLNMNQTSIQQTAASNIVAGLVADMRQAPTADNIAAATAASKTLLPVSPIYGISLATSATSSSPIYLNESGTVVPGAAARYQVNITTNTPSASRAATTAFIQITWPALATPANAAGSLNVFVALDRN